MINWKTLSLVLFLVLIRSTAFGYQLHHSGTSNSYSDTNVNVDTNGNPFTRINPISVSIGDSSSLDAAGRLRNSSPFGLFQNSLIEGPNDLVWEKVSSGASSNVTWNVSESTASLTIGTGASDYVYRQSRYIPYIIGKSQDIKITFILGSPVVNAVKRVGYFDDNDGLFLQRGGTADSVCLRTSTSGSPIDTCIDQNSWNLDRLDGTGIENPSGLNLDLSKSQLLLIDFLWQGVGRIRFGFLIDGKIYYVHEIENANVKDLPFMRTSNLPIRFEVRNLGASSGATMKQICVSVESEGGFEIPSKTYSASNGVTTRTISTRTPIIAIRLKNSVNGLPNRRLARLIHTSYLASVNDVYCEVTHNQGVTATAGGTWTSVNTDSALEYNIGITSITSTDEHLLDTNYVSAGNGQISNTATQNVPWSELHYLLQQNAASDQSQVFLIYCTSFGISSTVSAEINWIEN